MSIRDFYQDHVSSLNQDEIRHKFEKKKCLIRKQKKKPINLLIN